MQLHSQEQKQKKADAKAALLGLKEKKNTAVAERA